MERHLKRLAWLWVVYSGLVVVGATAGMLVFLFAVGDDRTAGELLFLAVGSLIGVVGGVGLMMRRSWARVLVLILGILHLMAFPVGTALGAYTMWVLLKTRKAEPHTA